MRIVVERDFPFTDMANDDLLKLHSFCIHTKTQESGTFADEVFHSGFIIGQKIDLEPDNIEIFLDILDFYSNESIYLRRYENGRYTLIASSAITTNQN